MLFLNILKSQDYKTTDSDLYLTKQPLNPINDETAEVISA